MELFFGNLLISYRGIILPQAIFL
uniref:Uncharacterized protein n=1 Tax=Arundo donax TaxID=35708 RepID=A0A0A9BEG2_ARUDO